jgi:hypothetical protein
LTTEKLPLHGRFLTLTPNTPNTIFFFFFLTREDSLIFYFFPFHGGKKITKKKEVPLVSPETSRPQLTEGLERREEEKYQKRHSTTLLYLLSSPSGGKLKEEQEEEEEEEGGNRRTDGRTDPAQQQQTYLGCLLVCLQATHTKKKNLFFSFTSLLLLLPFSCYKSLFHYQNPAGSG